MGEEYLGEEDFKFFLFIEKFLGNNIFIWVIGLEV